MLVVVVLTAFCAAGLTLFSGFGLGTLLLPAFALFFPPLLSFPLVPLPFPFVPLVSVLSLDALLRVIAGLVLCLALMPKNAARAAESRPPSRSIRVAERGAMGFVSRSAVEAATSIVGSPSAREWLAGGDIVYIGQGVGEVSVGDELTLFRDAEPVYDIRGGRQLGYHVDILGWLVVREVEGDSATAEIRMSRSEIARGDRLIPRIPPRRDVEVKSTPGAAEGNIVFIPEGRTQVADGDYVYLNRGSSDGLDLGSEMEVFIPGSVREERVRSKSVMTPDRTDGSLVIVEVKPNTAVAYVVDSKGALEVGDRVRPVAPRIAQR